MLNRNIKATQLLELLANSVYDRSPGTPLFFNATEIQLVEYWIRDLILELSQAGNGDEPACQETEQG